MALSDLTQNEQQVVFECLKAAVDGPFFPDWEFPTLFGLWREEVGRVVADWPESQRRFQRGCCSDQQLDQ